MRKGLFKMIDKTEIFEILKTENIPYRNYDHIPVYTVEEANSIDIPDKDKCLKNLFLKDKKGNFYLVSLNGGKSIDLKKLRAFLGSTHLHFAGEDDLYKVTGLRKGHVTPFGILNSRGYDVTAVFDTALENDIIGVHPMQNDATLFMKFEDMRRLIENNGFKVVMYEV